MRSLPDIVKQLMIINVLFFLGSVSLGNIAYDLLALHYPQNPKFAPWQVATHMFMHRSINHIIFNMFGLWMFGGTLAQMWGRNKFLFFYLSTGLGAAALQLGINYFQMSTVVGQLVEAGYSATALTESLQPGQDNTCLLYTSPSPRDLSTSRMPSSA